jgi:hypothetical protein
MGQLLEGGPSKVGSVGGLRALTKQNLLKAIQRGLRRAGNYDYS